ncbi:EAL domain-containing protein [Rhabdochromatium marinum]|uniref:EAL domain-containing protein n=1 Tax=Rhabdochromatium marinum TaxID=48729 RepID=UPI00190444D1
MFDPGDRLLSEIIEGNPVPTFVIDAEHRVTHWNRACEIVIGVSAADVIGTCDQWRAFYSEPRPVMADLVLDGALNRDFEYYYGHYKPSSFIDGACEAEKFFPDFPGGGRWLFFTAAPLRGTNGEIIGAIETLQDTTERKRAELARAESERRLAEENYKALFTEMINGFALCDLVLDQDGRPVDFRFIDVNPAFEGMTGLSAAKIAGHCGGDVLPKTRANWAKQLGQVALTGEPMAFEGHSEDLGKCFEVRAFRHSSGQVAATFQDISGRKQAELRLQMLASVFENTQEGIVITDPDTRILEVNDAFVHITGYAREELIGQTPRILKSGRHNLEFYTTMWMTLLEEGFWRGEIWNRRKSGEVFPEQLTISTVLDEHGRPLHFVAVVVDITAIKRHEAELDRIAHYDPLTGLPNRVLLNDRMQQAMMRSQRDGNLLAVCFLDVDGFKPVNDTYGHEAGDYLLIELADRFNEVLRKHETAARLGGDEFIILLADLKDQAHCIQALERIQGAIKRPFAIKGQVLSITASVGVSMYPMQATDSDTLIREADQAMYRAKQQGKNTHCFYEDTQDAGVIERQRMIDRVIVGIAAGELVLHYQPRVNMRSGHVIGVEALIRWHHPERGMLPPDTFIPILEDSDAIITLGEWVILEALRQLQRWEQQGLQLAVSINIAARHLQSSEFVARLEEYLRQAGRLHRGGLEIELTETSAIKDLRRIKSLIEACRALGVECALDDFGTGYSSLTYLKLLPVQTLKIDKSFVLDMSQDTENYAIVSGVIGLARAFGMTVIAEGVETTKHGVILLGLGCELGQGFGIAPPMSAERVPGWVRQWKADPAWAIAAFGG